MKKIIFIFCLLCTLTSCVELTKTVAYRTAQLVVVPQIEGAFEATPLSGAEVVVENLSTGAQYNNRSGEDGKAVFEMVPGLYRVRVKLEREELDEFGRPQKYTYNGAAENVRFYTEDKTLQIGMLTAKPSPIIIKEIYCGGCKKLPLDGTYQSDKYMILHNNSAENYYLDGLCFGCVGPYNATAANHWVTPDASGNWIFQKYAPIVQAIWQFPGDGDDFLLKPGDDAVVCFCGAIDHTAQFPLSVNLNHPDYFACYNNAVYDNVMYHPAPGDQIQAERILDLVVNWGQSSAYIVSVNSPSIVLFRTKEISVQEAVLSETYVAAYPGSDTEKIFCLPWEWILDGVEVYTASSNNKKRLSPVADAGYVVLSEAFQGYSLMRKKDDLASAAAGYEIMIDSNNSSEDFYQSEVQSLHR